jgi:hypothetical protein
MNWLKNEFKYPVPEDYLDFLADGDFETTLRKNYISDLDNDDILEISEWFTYDNLSLVYNNCLNEGMIQKFHLPIFDSCNCTIVIDCNIGGDSYGCVFSRTPAGYFDENLNKNIYTEFDLVAKGFSEIINNLKTAEELDENIEAEDEVILTVANTFEIPEDVSE